MLAFNYGGDKDHFVDLFIDNDQSVPNHYLGTVSVCNNPLCDCNSLTMYMHHANKSEETLKLICDLNERKIKECSDESVQHISLVKIINTQFSDK